VTRLGVAVLLALGAAAVVAVALGAGVYPVLGLADPGAVVRLLVPLLRAAADLPAAACLGSLVLGLLLDPSCAPGARRCAALTAATWSLCALGVAAATVADVSGRRVRADDDLVIGLLARATPLGWLLTAVGALRHVRDHVLGVRHVARAL